MSDAAKSPASQESMDVSKLSASSETKQNGNHSSDSISPESSISTSRGSTPNLTNANTDKVKMVDWWRRVAMDYASSPNLKNENWIQAFHDTDMEEVKDDFVEEFQQFLTEELKSMSAEQAKQHLDRLRSQLEIFEDNKLYEIQKGLRSSDKAMRFEYLSGHFMAETKHSLQEALKQKEQSIFAEEWRKEAQDYEKGVATDMDNNLRIEMGRTLEKTMRMFRNTATELAINKQTSIDIAENNVQSYAMNLTTNSEDRSYYLRSKISDYLTEQKQRHDNEMKETMEREFRTIRREMEQLKKNVGSGSAKRCCESMCVIL